MSLSITVSRQRGVGQSRQSYREEVGSESESMVGAMLMSCLQRMDLDPARIAATAILESRFTNDQDIPKSLIDELSKYTNRPST